MRITLQAAYSQYASKDDIKAAGIAINQLPHGLRLMKHQVQTYHALQKKSADVIVNGALTGDGKSLAGLLPMLLDRFNSLFTYPTNELMRDQRRSMTRTLREWGHTHPERIITTINAAELDAMQDKIDMDRPDALELMLSKDIVLTNPDILHLLMNFRYRQRGAAPDRLAAGKVGDRFGLICQDEFHVFGVPEATAMVIASAVLREMNSDLRFLLLSATVDENTQTLLERSGLTLHHIDGTYTHDTPPGEGWRRILAETTLDLHSGGMEDWVAEHPEDVILRFFQENAPSAKGALICNSVASAHVILAYLQGPCHEAGITLGINTGLTGTEDRHASLDADFIIGTSTVDVGVDFQINLLIFESTDAASHIQRLGRLGRHDTARDGSSFHTYEAHALVPPWVAARIAEDVPDGSSINREQYNDIVRAAFPTSQSYPDYPSRWGVLQAAHVLYTLGNPVIKTQYADLRAALAGRFEDGFQFGKQASYRYRNMRKQRSEVLREAISFRGSNALTALVQTGDRDVQPYSLLSLLPRADLALLNLETVLRHAEAGRYAYSRAALERHDALIAYRLYGWLPERRRISIYLDADIDTYGEPVTVTGLRLRIEQGNFPELAALNDVIEQQSIVVTVCSGYTVREIRRRLRLDGYFRLLPCRARNIDNGCIALGREALLFQVALLRSDITCGGRAIIL